MPRNPDYRRLILEDSDRVRDLLARIDETLPLRSRSGAGSDAWSQACRRWHEYESPLDELIERAYGHTYTDPDLLEFVITYLEVDPRHFRSGYHKERMLQRLKRAPLKAEHISRLRYVLEDAARKRGGREFRRYCRLAIVLADEALVRNLDRLVQTGDPKQRSRAGLMLRYIQLAHRR